MASAKERHSEFRPLLTFSYKIPFPQDNTHVHRPLTPEFGTLIYKVPTVVVSGLLIIARQLSSYLFYRSLSYSGH